MMFIDKFGFVTGGFDIDEYQITPESAQLFWGSIYKKGKTEINPQSIITYKKCKCLNGKWYPGFHFQLNLDVYWQTISARSHERRHANDLYKAYQDTYEFLSSAELNGYLSETECTLASIEIVANAISMINMAINSSQLLRDWPPFFIFEGLY